MKGTCANSEQGRGISLKQILVITQIALSFLLVLSAVLFVRTLANLHSIELGFDAKNVLTFNLNASKGVVLNAFYNPVRWEIP